MWKTQKYDYWLWRRKQSTALVCLFHGGNWNIFILDWDKKISINDFFAWHKHLLETALYPFYVLWSDFKDKFDVSIKVSWWWIRWQADAIKLWLSRALVGFNSEYRLQLKPYWLLKRDGRQKERKKYGLKKARKAPQWTKR